MLKYSSKEIVQIRRAGNGAPIYEMCKGCCRAGIGECLVITDPLHYYKNYGQCFAWMDAATAKDVDMQIRAYSNSCKETKDGSTK